MRLDQNKELYTVTTGFLRQRFESLPATLAMAGVMSINAEAPHLGGSSHSQTTITQGA